MLDTRPLADEFAIGQVGRWRVLNRFGRTSTLMDALRLRYGQSGLGTRSDAVIHVLAGLSGMERGQYARLHTMLPFTAFALSDRLRTTDHGWLAAVAKRSGRGTPRSAAYLCPACVQEDRGYWGYSYWRRSHQLPGQLWCDKHPDESLHAVTDAQVWENLPEFWLGRGLSKGHNLSVAVRDNPYVRRFGTACQAMLDGGRSRYVTTLRRALSVRAIAAGLAINGGATRRRRLSDLTRECFPTPFLQHLFPSLVNMGADDTWFFPIDAVARPTHPTPLSTGTAIAMSIFYPSISAAFEDIFRGEGEVRAKAKAVNHPHAARC